MLQERMLEDWINDIVMNEQTEHRVKNEIRAGTTINLAAHGQRLPFRSPQKKRLQAMAGVQI